VKTTDRIFTKIVPEMYLCTRKTALNFGSHPDLNQDPGILKHFYHCENSVNIFSDNSKSCRQILTKFFEG